MIGSISKIFPKRYCQSEGPRLNCSRSYEQRGSKPLSSAAGWVEAEIIFNLIFSSSERAIFNRKVDFLGWI